LVLRNWKRKELKKPSGRGKELNAQLKKGGNEWQEAVWSR